MSAAYVWSYLYLYELNLGRWKENSFHTFSTFVHDYRLKGTPPILEKGESRELEGISISYKCFIAQEFVREIPLISYGIHDAAPDCPKHSTQVSKTDTHPVIWQALFPSKAWLWHPLYRHHKSSGNHSSWADHLKSHQLNSWHQPYPVFKEVVTNWI